MQQPLLYIFFDGQCPMCVSWIKFLLDRDGYNRMRFAPLQSDWTLQFFEDRNLPHPGMESVIVYDGLQFYFGSEAILCLFSALPGIWKFLKYARCIPLRLRENLYEWIACNRNRWFTPYESCWIPKESDKMKFSGLPAQARPDRG